MGDNYKGHRIIGTDNNFIGLYDAEIETGRNVEKSMEIVLGSKVAQKHQLSLGDLVMSSHGLIDSNSKDIHNDYYKVVGILKPSQKNIDELLLTNLESVWEIHEHEGHKEQSLLEYHDSDKGIEIHDYDEEKEITALLVTFKSPRSVLTFPKKINKETHFQAVLPTYELYKLLDYTSLGLQTVSWIAYTILLIACLSIFVNLYKMVKDRAYHLAILRSYGASTIQLIKMLLYEAGLIVLFSLVLAYLLNSLVLDFLSIIFNESSSRKFLTNMPILVLLQTSFLIYVAVILSVGLAIIPILKMNISTILSNEK
jgi:putative ABC transport system permease protein